MRVIHLAAAGATLIQIGLADFNVEIRVSGLQKLGGDAEDGAAQRRSGVGDQVFGEAT